MTTWRTVKYLKSSEEGPAEDHVWDFSLELPEPLASWDVFAVWERERTEHMRKHLKHGDILFDVGSEFGWQSVVYAQFVGPQNVVLIEPSPEFWPTIEQIWWRNCHLPPFACVQSLVGQEQLGDPLVATTFPRSAKGEMGGMDLSYRYLHNNVNSLVPSPQITLDALVKKIVIPDAITIDVEGGELEVLRGAHDTLQIFHPKIWVSIHPDLLEQNYHSSADDLHELMHLNGYHGTHLATDHEEHWYFE